MFRRQLRLENRNQRRHGIDLKNPFTMSKNRGRGRFMLRSKLRSNFVLHPWILPVASAPSVAAKLRLMARFAALAGLAPVRISFVNSSPRLRLGGAYRDRTDDLKLAKLALSQLS